MAHIPVMYEECLKGLNLRADKTYLDMTIGGFGHGLGICNQLSEKGTYIGFDLDAQALKRAEEKSDKIKCNYKFIHDNFHNFKSHLDELGIDGVDGCLIDLGVSSFQIDEADRGFSFMHDGPLDMRMDNTKGITASDVINEYSYESLKDILWTYAEEKFAPQIARGIIKQREIKKIETTSELVEVVKKSIPKKMLYTGKNPAVKTFQAVRIEVNGELDGLSETLSEMIDSLNVGGRLCVISFHSLEDRIVKQVFAKKAKGCECPKDFPVCVCGKVPEIKIITKNAILSSEDEVESNPRSRSAKLRICEKIV